MGEAAANTPRSDLSASVKFVRIELKLNKRWVDWVELPTGFHGLIISGCLAFWHYRLNKII